MVLQTEDIARIMADRELFNATIYTPITEAIIELQERRHDQQLNESIIALLHGNIPQPLQAEPRAVIFRQVITPNYEIRRFVNITDFMDMQPLFWEYHTDMFTPRNEWKHALGKLAFFGGVGKKGGLKIDAFNIIDFNSWSGEKLSAVRTLWGQSLVEFHHEFFNASFRPLSNCAFDASRWFATNGKHAHGYYQNFLSLFIRHGILFENFMLNEKEFTFTRDVVMPAFIAVCNETGYKPLIVPLEPTAIEGERFWMCYPEKTKSFVLERLQSGDH